MTLLIVAATQFVLILIVFYLATVIVKHGKLIEQENHISSTMFDLMKAHHDDTRRHGPA